MVNFLKKALARGLTMPNLLSWLSLTLLTRAGVFWGTLCLKAKARLLGVAVSPGTTAHGKVGLLRWPGGIIEIGEDVRIISSWRRATASPVAWSARLRVFGPGAKIMIGNGAELSGTAITARSQIISIGQKVLIGPNCIIVDSDFHAPWPAETRASAPGYENDAPVRIEDYCWIGMNSIILKGVTIGKGAIIGAGSVVTRDIPAGCIACGVPCRVVRVAAS